MSSREDLRKSQTRTGLIAPLMLAQAIPPPPVVVVSLPTGTFTQ
jgi:hypothetical protein